MSTAPFKGAKPQKGSNEKKQKTKSPMKVKSPKDKVELKAKIVDKSNDEKLPSKDDMFREFRRICYAIADVSAYTEKTAIVKNMFTRGSKGGKFFI